MTTTRATATSPAIIHRLVCIGHTLPSGAHLSGLAPHMTTRSADARFGQGRHIAACRTQWRVSPHAMHGPLNQTCCVRTAPGVLFGPATRRSSPPPLERPQTCPPRSRCTAYAAEVVVGIVLPHGVRLAKIHAVALRPHMDERNTTEDGSRCSSYAAIRMLPLTG